MVTNTRSISFCAWPFVSLCWGHAISGSDEPLAGVILDLLVLDAFVGAGNLQNRKHYKLIS